MQKIFLFFFLLVLYTASHANPEVISREYKLMLKANLFQHNTEAINVGSFLDNAKTEIEAAIDKNVTGSESLEKIRDVKFYDTHGTCLLSDNGYSFRERIENGNSEFTLKFRSPDRYISNFEDLSATSSQAKKKLEADIGISSTSTFKVIYGHSNTVSDKRTIKKIGDINSLFPGFEKNYGFSEDIELKSIGNLFIREHVYTGREIKLGSFDAKISVTLWYDSVPTNDQNPVLVEVSFKYKDNSAKYTKKVVNRAKESFDALRSLTNWIDINSKTKTKWVYDSDVNFCDDTI